MKILVLASMILLSCLQLSGQAANQVFTNDTTKGAETIYFTGTKESSIYQGISGFVFTGNDSCTVTFQGCYSTNQWFDIDTVSVTTTAGYEVYQTPPRYKYYRIKAVGSAGDTCIFSNIRHYLKY